MHVRMVQHPVGQGGLHYGELTLGQKPLRWVYDCGSNQIDALTREITSVARNGNIDLLFISHLDSDHINGIDKLLSQVQVKEVVLPYLNQEALLAIIARDAARGTLTGVLVEAVNDLPGWFGSRGVKTVTSVEYSDDEGGDGPDIPDVSDGGGDGDCTGEWTDKSEPEPVSDTTSQIGKGTAQFRGVSSGSALSVKASNKFLNWALIPYVHNPYPARMKAFNDALDDKFGKNIDKNSLAQRAKEPTVRADLRDCYDALWGNHNLISMTLYCGPTRPENMEIDIHIPSLHLHPYWYGYQWPESGGWMLTGDAHLDGLRRRQRFLKFYQRFTGLTKVLMLPHHGSIHNQSDEVLNAMPKLQVAFAAAGPNSYGHPHKEVRYAVRAHPSAFFHQVDEKQFNQIEMKLRVPSRTIT